MQCTVVCFDSFLSSGFITAIVVNPPERKLAKRTPVQCKQNTLLMHRDCKNWQELLVNGPNLLWVKLNEYCKNLVPNRDLERLD